MADEWRTEADDRWLDQHRSDTFARLRRRMRRLGLVAGAVSHAELGPFGGAPRNPPQRTGGKKYSVVRPVTHRITYTTIHIYLQQCRRCGDELVEAHRIIYIGANGERVVLGTVRMCRRCQADSWLFHSRMPATARARTWARKVVL